MKSLNENSLEQKMSDLKRSDRRRKILVDPVWTREVQRRLEKHTSIFCKQAEILAGFAADVVQTFPAGKERQVHLRWLIEEAKRQHFNLTLEVKPDGVHYAWKQRRMRFKWIDGKPYIDL